MKKLLCTALLFCSYSLNAEELNYDLYVGGDLHVANKTEIDLKQAGLDEFNESNDLGFSIYGGANFMLAPKVNLGVDLEYQYFGKADSEGGIKVTGHGFFLNARPRFLGNQYIYTEFLAGFGTVTGELRGSSLSGGKSSDTEMGYQLGAGIGFNLNNFDINVSYRHRFTELFTYDTMMYGLVLGIRYDFAKEVLFK